MTLAERIIAALNEEMGGANPTPETVEAALSGVMQCFDRLSYMKAAARAGRSYPVMDSLDPNVALAGEMVDDEAVVRIQGPMDGYWGVSAERIIAKLDSLNATKIRLLIDSPGGLVSEGLSLYTDLNARMAKGTTIITEGRGLVASAAVLPFLAANLENRSVRDGTMIMIHNPWTFLMALGDVSDLSKESSAVINGLKAHTDNYVSLLAKRVAKTKKEAADAMNAESWYPAEEAVTNGFAKVVLDAADDDAAAKALDTKASRMEQVRQTSSKIARLYATG